MQNVFEPPLKRRQHQTPHVRHWIKALYIDCVRKSGNRSPGLYAFFFILTYASISSATYPNITKGAIAHEKHHKKPEDRAEGMV